MAWAEWFLRKANMKLVDFVARNAGKMVCRWSWVALAAVLAGCASVPGATPVPTVLPRPAWIDSPGDGVSASAGMHVKGEQAQEELAVARAREEFAKRYGVSISSEQEIMQSVSGGRAVTTSEKGMRESMDGNQVRATVKEKWRDPASGALWVWVVPAR